MAQTKKEWLVRTFKREILGPYTFEELVEAYDANQINLHDEIAVSEERWISAQTLTSARVREAARRKEPPPSQMVSQIIYAEKARPMEPALWHLLATSFIVFVVVFSGARMRKAEAEKPLVVLTQPNQSAATLSILLKGRQFKEALQFLQAHEASIANSASLQLIHMALSIREGKDLESVSNALMKLERRMEHSDELQFWRGYYLMRRGNYDEAKIEFLGLLPKRPNSASLNYNLAWAFFELGEKEKAETYFKIASSLDPEGVADSTLQHRLGYTNRTPSAGTLYPSELSLEFFVPLKGISLR